MTEFKEYVSSKYAHESIASPDKGLRRSLKPFLRALATRYDDLETIDKITSAQAKLDRLTHVMVENVHLATERDVLIERVHSRSETLNAAARALFSTGQRIRRRKCCSCVSSYAILVVITAAALTLLALIVVALNYSTYHWW
jgi:hypothetical protein